MTVPCAFSEPDSRRAPPTSPGCFPNLPLSSASVALINSVLSIDQALGSVLGWRGPCAPQCVGCPVGAVLLGWTGTGIQGSLEMGFQRLCHGHWVKQSVGDDALLFSNITLQPSPQDDLLPWHLTMYCTGFLLILPMCDEHWLSAHSGLIGIWLGIFIVRCFFTKTHCSGCVLMQADFEGLIGIRTLACTTSLLLSKPQNLE